MNVLFSMADQLRGDHLGCAGHPYLKTPNIDALARRGVRFANAFVNSGVCGPSRMSYYTGRYPITHGASWNRMPLSVGEVTLGEMLRGAGHSLALVGKTHVMPDHTGLARLPFDGSSELGALLARGGFEEVDRYDGHHTPGSESGYPAFLRAQGYAGDGAVPRDVHGRAMPAGGAPGLPGTHLAARPPLGRLFAHMAASGRLADTLIAFTPDHGDFLGDHWLGEKELFYDTVQKVPFIVVDPRPIPKNFRTSAAMLRQPPSAARCAAVCSNSWPAASTAQPSPTKRLNAVPAPTRELACSSASGRHFTHSRPTMNTLARHLAVLASTLLLALAAQAQVDEPVLTPLVFTKLPYNPARADFGSPAPELRELGTGRQGLRFQGRLKARR